jgi:hypothetical protein
MSLDGEIDTAIGRGAGADAIEEILLVPAEVADLARPRKGFGSISSANGRSGFSSARFWPEAK